jgi:hypothetical protein
MFGANDNLLDRIEYRKLSQLTPNIKLVVGRSSLVIDLVRFNVPPASSPRELIAVVIQELQSNSSGVRWDASSILSVGRESAYATNLRNPSALRTGRSLLRHATNLLYRPDHPPLAITRPSFCRGQRLKANDGFLVELTGIEPVASWLQTRRSPS